jgi:nitroreductase
MFPIDPDTLIQALQWRYATKAFDPGRTVPQEQWDALEASLVLTPSSFGLQPYRFIVVTDGQLRAELRKASWGQAQITDCSHLVVFTAKRQMEEADVDHYIGLISKVRGSSPEDLAGFRNVMVNFLTAGSQAGTTSEWAARQAYIALGQFMASAAMVGLDTCPIEGLDAAQYDQILGLQGGAYRTLVACAVGYRLPDDKYASLPKVRFPRSELVERR